MERVDAARAIQSRRFEGTGIPCNAQMTPPMVGRFCELDSRCDALMKSAFERMGLTARSHDRVLRVARTIADLDGAEHIGVEHLSDAIQYRNTYILKGYSRTGDVSKTHLLFLFVLTKHLCNLTIKTLKKLLTKTITWRIVASKSERRRYTPWQSCLRSLCWLWLAV